MRIDATFNILQRGKCISTNHMIITHFYCAKFVLFYNLLISAVMYSSVSYEVITFSHWHLLTHKIIYQLTIFLLGMLMYLLCHICLCSVREVDVFTTCIASMMLRMNCSEMPITEGPKWKNEEKRVGGC